MLVSGGSVRAVFDERFHRRFWSYVEEGETGECWPWIGSSKPTGHGQVWYTPERRQVTAHRVAFALEHGLDWVDLTGVVIRHVCDNPPCCNPAHLLAGTMGDNARDRQVRCHGASLRPFEIRALRSAYRTKRATATELAEQYGLTIGSISPIARGERWRDTGGPTTEADGPAPPGIMRIFRSLNRRGRLLATLERRAGLWRPAHARSLSTLPAGAKLSR